MADMRVSTGYLRRLQQEANNELDRRYFAAVATEIESLRAENQSWRSLDTIRLDMLRQSAAEVQRLQALIDAYAVAWHKGGWAGDTPVLMAASDALLAAATKDDADGR